MSLNIIPVFIYLNTEIFLFIQHSFILNFLLYRLYKYIIETTPIITLHNYIIRQF